jgi:hypothetical protein
MMCTELVGTTVRYHIAMMIGTTIKAMMATIEIPQAPMLIRMSTTTYLFGL